MKRFRAFASMFGVKHAIILAPMAGGTSTPTLVAAVSNAGGLGSFGAGYMTPEEIAQSISAIHSLTDKPFAVNLFAGGDDGSGSVDPSAMMELMAPYHARLGLPAPTAPAGSLPPFEEQVEVVLRSDVPIFSFTFGIPEARVMSRMKERGIKVIGTATTVSEARALEAAGVDAIVAQGGDAGSHRGTFLGALEDSLVGTMALVPQVVDVVSIPVIASGGIMDGRGIVAAAALGRKRSPDGDGVSGMPGKRRCTSLQGRCPRRARRQHRADARIQRTARPRHRQCVHRIDEGTRVPVFALPIPEQPDPADAQCRRATGRCGLHFAVRGPGGVDGTGDTGRRTDRKTCPAKRRLREPRLQSDREEPAACRRRRGIANAWSARLRVAFVNRAGSAYLAKDTFKSRRRQSRTALTHYASDKIWHDCVDWGFHQNQGIG